MLSDDGTVSRDTVLKTLQDNEVFITPTQEACDEPSDLVILVKGNHLEARRIPDRCGRKLLHYLSRKFEIYIHKFYD